MCYTAQNLRVDSLMPEQPLFSATLTQHMQQSPPDALYHYTSQDGLLGIIQSRALWATNISYMNDATEFDLSLGLLKDRLFQAVDFGLAAANPVRSIRPDHIKEYAQTLWKIVNRIGGSNICITCFCEQGDLLSQWRGYSGGGYGYSLAFRTPELHRIASDADFILGKCIYDPDLQNQIINELLDYLLGNGGHGKPLHTTKDFLTLLKYGAFFKNPSFQEEQEWRLVCALPTNIRFRKGKSMIIPYTSLDISAAENLCVKHAFVGPCPHTELSKSSVEKLLAINNVLTIVYSSSIPFRDW
jgi:hypothetical protein